MPWTVELELNLGTHSSRDTPGCNVVFRSLLPLPLEVRKGQTEHGRGSVRAIELQRIRATWWFFKEIERDLVNVRTANSDGSGNVVQSE